MRLIKTIFLLLCILCMSNPVESQTRHVDSIQTLQPTRMKFKKRSSLMSRIMNNFDMSEVNGYRCVLTFLFTNNDSKQQTIDPSCFCLKDDDGNVFDELDTEAEDYRANLLTGPRTMSPNIPQKIKLTFIVPDKNRKYQIVFKGYK